MALSFYTHGSIFDDLFGDNFYSGPRTLSQSLGRHPANGAFAQGMAALDVVEGENEWTAKMDVPGLKDSDIKVQVRSGNLLTISGERNNETTEKGHYERSYGSFNRTIRLKDNADLQAVSASLRNGVLEVKIPKTEKPPSEVQNIPVKMVTDEKRR